LRELARASGASGDEATIPPALREVRQYMETRLDRPLGLGQLARRAHLSVSQFSAAFRRYYGEAPIRYLLGLRMRRAALLLADPSLSVGDVASAVGVSDPLYFSRLFRRHWGVCPTAYRQAAPADTA
jgi:transcriptional regulator GlxA family with amidase domain